MEHIKNININDCIYVTVDWMATFFGIVKNIDGNVIEIDDLLIKVDGIKECNITSEFDYQAIETIYKVELKKYVTIEWKDIEDKYVNLLKEFKHNDDNSMGGLLHIILEDGNIEDYHLKSCLTDCILENDKIGCNILNLLIELSVIDRYILIEKFYHGYY